VIEIITTGGSIAELFENGSVRHLTGDELVAELRRGANIRPSLRVKDLLAVPSTWITPQNMHEIGRAVLMAHSDKQVAGVVVAHGTATLEETAFFVDLMLEGQKPAVFTGAQRYPATHGYDGYRNLQDAIAVANSSGVKGLGSLIVMNGEIHLACDAVKTHASSMCGFASPGWGPVGVVHGDTVHIKRRPSSRFNPIMPNGEFPRVDVITTYTGMDGLLLDASIAGGAKGIIIQGMSSIGIPDTLITSVASALQRRVPVVITSRCIESGILPGSLSHFGIAGYSGELSQLGVAVSSLHAIKARCRLLALLSAGADERTIFEQMNDAAINNSC
jgi:L-asparaginase